MSCWQARPLKTPRIQIRLMLSRVRAGDELTPSRNKGHRIQRFQPDDRIQRWRFWGKVRGEEWPETFTEKGPRICDVRDAAREAASSRDEEVLDREKDLTSIVVPQHPKFLLHCSQGEGVGK